MTATDCLELRMRLAEHAVSTLPEQDERDVERHLEWCAGCRKEARELQEGAAIAGLSLPPLEPPGPLEDRVVAGVQRAAARGRPGHTRTYLRRTVTVLAALLGILGVSMAGVILAHRQLPPARTSASEQSARATIRHLRHLYLALQKGGQPSTVSQVVLTRPGRGSGVGGALLVAPSSSSPFPDQLVVLVGGLNRAGAPYRVWLAGARHRRFMVPAFMTPDVGGGGELTYSSARLDGYRAVEVRDAKRRLVLSGRFPRSP